MSHRRAHPLLSGAHGEFLVSSASRRETGVIQGSQTAGRISIGDAMDGQLTIEQLESRWDQTLRATRRAVTDHPRTYRKVKAQASAIIDSPLDIQDYLPTVEKLTARLKTLDPCGQGSIFDFFNDRIAPTSVWHVKMLRMECTDLLDHLNAFDQWRRDQHRLRRIK